jgi:hypothetical protein
MSVSTNVQEKPKFSWQEVAESDIFAMVFHPAKKACERCGCDAFLGVTAGIALHCLVSAFTFGNVLSFIRIGRFARLIRFH